MMTIDLPKDTRIIVLEGIAGSGKTTFKKYLLRQLKDKKLYEYFEEEVLLGWKHIHLPGMSAIRMDFFELFITHLEKKLQEDKDAFFLLERFHLSLRILEWEFEGGFQQRYDRLIERLLELPIHILITKLEKDEIRKRMHHRERSRQWSEFVEEKLNLRGYKDLEILSVDQQNSFFSLAKEQGISYSAIHVELD